MSSILSLNDKVLDELVHLLQNPDKMASATSAQLAKLEQIDYADNMIRRYPRQKEAAIQVQTKYRLSKTNAYLLLKEAQYVHGSTPMYVKDYWKNILIEKALIVLDRCVRNSRDKEFNMTMKNLIMLFGYGTDNEKGINAEMLQQHNYMIQVNIKNSGETFEMDMNKIMKLPVEQRMKLVHEVETQNIEFDMIAKIEAEEAEDAE